MNEQLWTSIISQRSLDKSIIQALLMKYTTLLSVNHRSEITSVATWNEQKPQFYWKISLLCSSNLGTTKQNAGAGRENGSMTRFLIYSTHSKLLEIKSRKQGSDLCTGSVWTQFCWLGMKLFNIVYLVHSNFCEKENETVCKCAIVSKINGIPPKGVYLPFKSLKLH